VAELSHQSARCASWFPGVGEPPAFPVPPDGQIRLRCIIQPGAAQAALLDRLGIVLPKRMRLAEHELPALAASA
jgi:hypothetical protein